jgi:RND family efflux transporter MFP subunit
MAIVRRVIAWLFVLGIIGGLTWLFIWRSENEKKVSVSNKVPTVRVKRPTLRDLPIRLTYPAELQAIQAYEMRPVEAKGYVKRITVDKGDKVKKGQLLVGVDCPEYHARRKQASEGVRSAKAIYVNSKLVLQRLEPMRAKNFVSQLELDAAQAAYDSAEARLKNQEARLAESDDLLNFCDIRAPFDGEVLMRFIDVGEQVRPGGRPLLSIIRRNMMRVQLNVVERDDPHLREGLPVELTIHGLAGQTFHGTVTRVVRQLDPSTRTFLVEIEIPNPSGVLQPGMFGRVSLVVDRHSRAVLIPAAALLATDNGTFVHVVREGRAHRTPIEIGYDTGEEIEVLKGLRGTESVVTVGRDLLQEGAPVNVAE